jgi:glutaredoxin
MLRTEMSSVPPRRCSEHDLALDRHGGCVVCRRALNVSVPQHELNTSSSGLGWAFGLALLLAGGATAWAVSGGRAATREPSANPLQISATALTVRPPTADELEKSSDPDELARASKLNAARSDKVADPPEQLARLEAQKLEAEARRQEQQAEALRERDRLAEQRKLEEAERDRKRHEEVKRQLDGMAAAGARRGVTITMYSTSWCGACAQARSYMEREHIAFTDFDVEKDVAARARAQALNPRGSVPTIAVDDEVLIGFSASSLQSRIELATQRRGGS